MTTEQMMMTRADAPPEPLREQAPSRPAGAERERVPATRVASALDLLDGSQASLLEAGHAEHIGQRYAVAQLSALRAAAAVLAVRGPRLAGSRGSGGPRNLWEILPAVAPELQEWADFFALCATRREVLGRASDTAYHPGPEGSREEPMTVREADDLVRSAQQFHDRVRTLLGLTRRTGPVLLAPMTT